MSRILVTPWVGEKCGTYMSSPLVPHPVKRKDEKAWMCFCSVVGVKK